MNHPAALRSMAPWGGVWWMGTLALVAMCLLGLGAHPRVDDIRWVIRATARTSLLAFVLAYGASTGVHWWSSPATRWVRSHRRQWGLLMASSHTLHALGIASLATMADPALFAKLTPLPSRVLGGAGYLALIAMTLTSFDGAAAWLGRARWTLLHTWGGHLIWLVFLMSMIKRAPGSPLHAMLALGLLVLMGLKLGARRRRVQQMG